MVSGATSFSYVDLDKAHLDKAQDAVLFVSSGPHVHGDADGLGLESLSVQAPAQDVLVVCGGGAGREVPDAAGAVCAHAQASPHQPYGEADVTCAYMPCDVFRDGRVAIGVDAA